MAKTKIMTVGSDPEFLIVDSMGACVPADKIFAGCGDCIKCEKCGKQKCNGNRRLCGACDGCDSECDACDACYDCESCRWDPEDCDFCDDCMSNNDVDFDGAIGCDGCSEVGELRPTYGETPQEHHDNIAELIKQIDIPDKYELRAGTRIGGYDLGGHIHLGIKAQTNQIFDPINAQKAALYISKYAGMPLRKIEHPNDLKFRGLVDYGYGQFGAHSDRRYGIEWRMPASWLVSSEIALSALCLAHLVAHEYLIEPKTILKPTVETQKRTLGTSTFVPKIIAKIEKMKHYPKYSTELEPLFQMLVNGKEWNTDTDIRNEW